MATLVALRMLDILIPDLARGIGLMLDRHHRVERWSASAHNSWNRCPEIFKDILRDKVCEKLCLALHSESPAEYAYAMTRGC